MLPLSMAILVFGVTVGAQSPPATDNAFPRMKAHGRATVDFQDQKVHAVAIDDDTHRNHNGGWIPGFRRASRCSRQRHQARQRPHRDAWRPRRGVADTGAVSR
jgi:hypothetical protein